MELRLENLSKRFQYEWIFKSIDLHIPAFSHWAITGSNGSGKSTLLKCIAGVQPPTSGKVIYSKEAVNISVDDIFSHLLISAPYMELPEEFTLHEMLQFHSKFKQPNQLSLDQMMDIMYLSSHRDKPVSQFSSGMKQRLKLGLCFFFKGNLVLLDEPTSNLDEQGISWYLHLVKEYSKDKTLFISSNDPREYSFCPNEIKMQDFKPR